MFFPALNYLPLIILSTKLSCQAVILS